MLAPNPRPASPWWRKGLQTVQLSRCPDLPPPQCGPWSPAQRLKAEFAAFLLKGACCPLSPAKPIVREEFPCPLGPAPSSLAPPRQPAHQECLELDSFANPRSLLLARCLSTGLGRAWVGTKDAGQPGSGPKMLQTRKALASTQQTTFSARAACSAQRQLRMAGRCPQGPGLALGSPPRFLLPECQSPRGVSLPAAPLALKATPAPGSSVFSDPLPRGPQDCFCFEVMHASH